MAVVLSCLFGQFVLECLLLQASTESVWVCVVALFWAAAAAAWYCYSGFYNRGVVQHLFGLAWIGLDGMCRCKLLLATVVLADLCSCRCASYVMM